MTETPEEQLSPKKEITAEEFIKIWKGEYKGVKGYDHYYIDNKVSIIGHKIIDDVQIVDTTLMDIGLENTFFKRSITINKSIIQEIRINNSRLNYLYLADCSNVNLSITIEKSSIRGIQLIDSTISSFLMANVYGMFNISLQKVDIRLIYITECTLSSFSTYNSQIDKIDISQSASRNILFDNVEVKSELYINKQSNLGNINILNHSTIEKMWLRDSVTSPRIHFKESTIKKALFGKGTTIGVLFINSLTSAGSSIDIHCAIIDKLKIDTDNPCKVFVTGEVSDRTIINELILKHTVMPGDMHLNISDTDINNICFDSFVNSGRIIFNNIRPATDIKIFQTTEEFNEPVRKDSGEYVYENITLGSIVEITNSDLGNTQFIGCDLDLFDDFVFENSKILNVFIADTFLPKKENINKEYPKDYEQQRLILNQFKKIFENQGDSVRASEYHAQELDVYKKQLRFKEKPWTWLILWLSSITSDFGQNIWKPLASLLTVHYWLYMWTLGVNAIDIKNCQEVIHYYFYLANPLHQYIFCNDWTIIIDILMRIWSSYMIYNFIRASRRFIK